jgi:hypothetical protein
MTLSRLAAVAMAGVLCLRCIDGPSLGALPTPPEVLVTPLRDEGTARVVRLEIRAGGGIVLNADELWLFSGELSDYHVGRVNRRDLPATLVARQLPALAWSDDSGNIATVAPSVALEPGVHYTLAAPGFGRLAELDVAAEDSTPLLERVWPPRGSAVATLLALCAESPIAEAPFRALVEPSGLEVEIEPGLGSWKDGRACVSARLPAELSEFGNSVFPAEANGFLFDPEPLVAGLASALRPAHCVDGELALGPGCARVDDDRLSVRSADEPLLWVMETGASTRIELPGPAGLWFVRDLEPDSEQRLVGRAVDLAGIEHPFDVTVRTLPEHPHLVLNEVLSNPVGAEPAGEWVELFNDGRGPVALSSLRLRDSTSAVELPSATVAAGQYLLLVNQGFSSAAGVDVSPALGTELVRLPLWPKGGLSNSGEPLQLEDAQGVPISRFPMLASRHAGTSFARFRPDSSDDDLSAFAEHAPPGASPGAANVLLGAVP